MKSVGIDIGTSQIKVVEVQQTSKGVALANYYTYTFSGRTNSDQDLETIEYLRELVSKFDHSQTHFCIGLRQDRAVIRNKVFPFTERLKIAKILPLELDEDIPFSIEDSVYDAKIIRTLGTTSEVLACAAPKKHLESLLSLMKDSGIDPEVVSTEGIAFANLFERWEAPPPHFPPLELDLNITTAPTRELHLVLNIGHTRTLVCAFENNQLVGVRSIYWGGRQIAEAISKKYELPLTEAIKEMELKAFILTTKQESHFEAKIFSDTISKAVREMLRDLQLSILEIRSEFNAMITRVDITGGVSHIQGLGPFMTQVLELPVNKIHLLDRFSQVYFEKTDLTDSRLGIATGLAIEGLKKPRNPALNFLRGVYAKKNNQLEALLNQWNVAAKVGAALLVIFYIWAMTRESLTANLQVSSQEALKAQAKTVAHLGPKQLNEDGVKKYIREKKKIAAELKTLSQVSQMNSAFEILKKVNDAIPAKTLVKMDVRRFHLQETQTLLEGYLGSVKEVAQVQKALQGVAQNAKVSSLRSQMPNIVGKTTFAFRFVVDRGIVHR